MSRRIIRTDGTEVPLEGPTLMDEIRRLIGAEVIDVVNLRHLGHPMQVMILDDQGYETKTVDHGGGDIEMVPIRALKPVNRKATELYWRNCVPGTTHEIVGDVAVVFDDDYAA